MKRKRYYGIYFLSVVIFLYFILFIFEPAKIQKSLFVSWDLLIQIVPVIFLVIIFMGVINYFANPKAVLKYTGKNSGAKGYFIAAFCGILSHGSVYFWYPLLKELKGYGMRDGISAVFLYNRAIKVPLLPLMIYYFGLTFALVLLIYMIIASFIEGEIIELMERKRFSKQAIK